jgi:hypothetical protein
MFLSLEIEEIRKTITFIKISEVKPIWIGILLGWVTYLEFVLVHIGLNTPT